MLDAKCKEPFKDRISNSIVNVKKKGWSMCKNHLGRRRPSWWTMPIFSALLSSSELCSLSICLLPSLQANHIHKRLTCNIFFTIQELFVHAKLFRSRMWSKGGEISHSMHWTLVNFIIWLAIILTKNENHFFLMEFMDHQIISWQNWFVSMQ